jgi:hypothetical protein
MKEEETTERLEGKSDLNPLIKRSARLEPPKIWEMDTSFNRQASRTIFSQILTWRTPLVLEELDQFKAPIIVVKVCRRSNVK